MTQQALNTLIYFLLAKFILNDLPHASGLSSSSSKDWLPSALVDLQGYIARKSIRPNVLREIRREEVFHPEGLKLVLAGYYRLATGTATDEVIQDITITIKQALEKFAQEGAPDLLESIGPEALYEEAIGFIDAHANGFRGAYKLLTSASSSRSEKAVSIDTIVALEHDSGLVLCYLFGFSYEDGVSKGVRALLDKLSGRLPTSGLLASPNPTRPDRSEPPTPRQLRYIALLCMQLKTKEPLEEKVRTSGEAGVLIRELEKEKKLRRELKGGNLKATRGRKGPM